MEESSTTPSDDVVGEILLRINDVATLFRCAATCKSWRRRIANPYFLLRRQWPPSPVVGFFTKRRPDTETTTTDSSSQLAFVPLPGPSLLGDRPRALSSFIHADDAAAAAVVDGATPLATRGGLLLVRLYSIDDDLNRKTFTFPPVFSSPVVRLVVCNLLAGTWDVLPELNCQTRFRPGNRYGCDIIPNVAGDGSPAFKVLMVGADKDEFNLHTFVSGEASWRAPTKCFDMTEGRMYLSMENTGGAVVCGGYAHWLFASEPNHFHVLNVDVETGHVSLTKLQSPTRDDGLFCQVDLDDYDAAMAHNERVLHDLTDANRLVTTSNGTRLSVCTYRGRRLEIWTRHQDDDRHERGDGDADWRHTAGETDQKLTELIQQLERPSCIWSGERSGTMLIRECPGERVFIAHLDTGTLEEATGQFPDQPRNGIMPVEIDWPTYFMLRLGGSV